MAELPRRYVTIVRFGYLTRLTAAVLAAMVLLSCEVSYSAQRTIEWFDESSCSYKMRFNPKKYDAARLKNTADFVFSRRLLGYPIPQGFLNRGDSGVNAYRDVCSQHARELASFALVDLPGIEAYRELRLGELQEWCGFGAALIRGALGDVAAMRSFTPSADHCSRYLDALEGKIDMIKVWRETVTSACVNNYKPEVCRAEHFSAQRQPDALERIKRDVLTDGWQNCSVRYLMTASSARRKAESMERQLQAGLRRRFRMARAPCAD